MGCKAQSFFMDEAKKKFLDFATSFDALWFENFRDLNGAIIRVDVLAPRPLQISADFENYHFSKVSPHEYVKNRLLRNNERRS